ncbi:MAG: hypothetical protein HWE18_14435 [Gammaproteobacteria bacterium]|nr:hypothetical protein [Gammaproteobacteria bacterium]
MLSPYPQDAFLLGYLLDVNAHPKGWDNFMQAMLTHFNTRSVHLYVVNNDTQSMRFHIDAGVKVDAAFMAEYVEKYVHEDRLLAAINARPLGQFYASNMLPEELDIYGNEYYQQWALPQGIKEATVARIFEDNGWTCYMASNRSPEQGIYTQEEIDRLNALIPFIEKTVRASSSLAESDKHELRAKSLVNTFRFPAAVLTEYGDLWAMNQPMELFLRNQSQLYLEQNSLKLENLNQDKSLNLGILQTAKRAEGIQMEMTHSESIQITQDTSIGFHALVEPHQGQATFLGVMVYVIDPSLNTPPSIERLQSLFQFTQSEAEVCQLIAQGLLPKQIASIKNKSTYTVREQLSSVFKKTGCSSQVTLLNLLANIPHHNAIQ